MNWEVRNPLHCTADGCTAKAEIEALREKVAALTQERDTLNAALDAKITICGDASLAIAQARIKELREALIAWATLVEFQYTGSKEAMTHLQICDNIGQEALEATK
jgi:hypothetical protein